MKKKKTATTAPSPERSATMRAVKAKDTKPEMVVRRLVHALGYRFRLHRADLPGKPDLVFPSRRKVVLVNGCWWHGHSCKRGARPVATNVEYWTAKISRNVARDRTNISLLKAAGWRALVVWECQLGGGLRRRLARFLER